MEIKEIRRVGDSSVNVDKRVDDYNIYIDT